MKKPGPKPKKLCIRGHNKDITGRNKAGRCNECCNEYSREYWRKHYIPHPLPSTQFCPNGHDTFIVGRYGGHTCKICAIGNVLKSEAKNPEKAAKRKHKAYLKNRIACLKKQKIYDQEHPDIVKLCKLRQDKKRKLRIPKWGQEGINEFYRDCPKNKEVDHIIPLCGKKVSGLHVYWNLQYLTPKKNKQKNNNVDLKKVSKAYGKLLKKLGLK
jgi:hypothetical protein